MSDITYGGYLRVDELLQLQSPRSEGPQHDELLFIVIHQVYELWFKQLLHEIDYARLLLSTTDADGVAHTCRRILSILKTVVSQADVLETMTPLEFSSFRSFLSSASGFQSAQFRALEFALGYKRPNIINVFQNEPTAQTLLHERLKTPSLWDAFLAYIEARGHRLPESVLQRDRSAMVEPDEALQDVLVDMYRRDPTARNISERLLDIDEGVQEWRYRHTKMVERTIGIKMGTGGSPGVSYLLSTLKPVFPDLWAIRSRL